MTETLLVYATTHGHTEKIAARIAQGIRDAGARATVLEPPDAVDIDPDRFDAVIVGASVHLGRHQSEVAEWVRDNRDWLERVPSAFFSVSLAAADEAEEAQEATRETIDSFCEETGWSPSRTLAVAGALQYREYDVFTRSLMRLMMKLGDRPVDTSHDHELTDWDQVDAFAREFAAAVAGR